MLHSGNSARWTACPASAVACPEEGREAPSEAAVEADAARMVAAMVLRSEVSCGSEVVGRVAPLGWTVGSDEARAADEFAAGVRDGGGLLLGDMTLSLPYGPPVRVLDIIAGRDTVWYMDYGRRPLDVAVHTGLILGAIVQQATRMMLFQPRASHPEGRWRSCVFTGQEAWRWAEHLGRTAEDTTDPDARAWPGRHCTGCWHKSRCAALRNACYAETARDDGRRGGEALSAAVIAIELETAEAASAAAAARLSGIRAEVEARVKRGEWIPGWHLVPAWGRREFTVGPDAVALMTGIKATRTVRRSPAELERDGASRAVLDGITRRPAATPRLTRLTEADIASMFGERKKERR